MERHHDRTVPNFVSSPASLTSPVFPSHRAHGIGEDGLGAGQYSVLQDIDMIEGPQGVDKSMEAPAVSAFDTWVGANRRTQNSDVLIIHLLVIIAFRMRKPSRLRAACGSVTPSLTWPLRSFSTQVRGRS